MAKIKLEASPTLLFAQVWGVAIASMAPVSASAQQASHPTRTGDAAASVRPADQGLAEIVVTAQRRAERLIDVPLAIQAVGDEALRKEGVTNLEQLQSSVLGLTMQYGSNGQLTPFLRGVGNSIAGDYAENSIAIYVDDVPRPRSSGSTELANVERVEILKGPQGALYGRNATGGAINVITREPSNELSGLARLTYGQFHTFEGQAYINVPVSDRVAFNLAFSHRERDGLIHNLSPYSSNPLRPSGDPLQIRLDPNFQTPVIGPSHKQDYENQDNYSLDYKLRFNLSDNLKVVLRADYTVANDTGTTGWVNTEPQVLAGALSFLTGITFSSQDILTGQRGRTAYSDEQGFKHLEDYGGSIKVDLNLDSVAITSITSQRWNRFGASSDIDGTQIPVAGFTGYFRSQAFTQELRAASTGNGPLRWMVGGSYFRDKVHDLVAGEIGSFLAGINTNSDGSLFTKTQYLSGQIPRITLPNLIGDLDVHSYAFFAQAGYDISPRLQLIASGRYTRERRVGLFPGQTLTGGVEFTGRRNEHAFTPSVTVNYKFPDAGLIYARWAKGYKSGGINNLLNPTAAVGNGIAGVNQFKPEKLTSYELGYKADLLDRRIRVEAAIYYYKYENIQVARTLSPSATSFVLNADKATVKGAEISLTGKVSNDITLSGGASYTNGTYKNFVVADQVNFDASGHRMINTPKWQLQGSVNILQPLTERLVLTASAAVSYRSGLFFDPENTQALHQNGYAIVNGRIGLQTSDEKYAAYIFARNLFNKVYAQFGQRSAFGTFMSFGDRRVVGATVEAKF